jgi:hypothetical protein
MVMSVGFDNVKFFGQFLCPALGDRSHHQSSTLSMLDHMAAIVLRPFSGNFTRSETHAVQKSEVVLSYF